MNAETTRRRLAASIADQVVDVAYQSVEDAAAPSALTPQEQVLDAIACFLGHEAEKLHLAKTLRQEWAGGI